ncbi:uncharacterized protein BJ212DRAFT_1482023 [Suillus subaureus]|uniref:Uncharacterized protein n=1 Tax=Suillus subaureus TaxID=48587 RepID=A0A9P7E8E3_9AGAM|nr:uncharacterized protein BJ212DRAFT_1482023 [Suillus subaureus]KAG1814284.1 hypothetical protein BJ212DRAFT_1482023 [Suillus subaureus]
MAPTNAVRCGPSSRSAGGSGTASTHTANPIPTIAASTKSTRLHRKFAAFAHAYYSQYNTNQTPSAGSNANAAVNNTSNTHTYASGSPGTLILGTTGPTGIYYPYYYPFTTAAAANLLPDPRVAGRPTFLILNSG